MGSTPDTPAGRRVARQRALELQTRLHTLFADQPVGVLLNVVVDHDVADVVVMHPTAIIVGLIRDIHGPVQVFANGEWRYRDSGQPIVGPHGETLLQQINRCRDLVCRRIDRALLASADPLADAQSLQRTVGALIIAPRTHAETTVSMDIDDHRRQIKVLGLDELPGLALMSQTGVQLSAELMAAIMERGFGARLWHDGSQLLFELGLASYHLRLRDGTVMPLIEGVTMIGRRETPLHHEYRLVISNDDSVSSDHAVITSATDGRVLLRDISTNGTWVAPPGGVEHHVHRTEYELSAGTTIRMGETRMVLEADTSR